MSIKSLCRKHPRERRRVSRRSGQRMVRVHYQDSADSVSGQRVVRVRYQDSADSVSGQTHTRLSRLSRLLSQVSDIWEEYLDETLEDNPNENKRRSLQGSHDPKEKLDEREIQVALYQRKCAKLNVCPVGAYVRNPTSPVLNIGNYCLGPTGALALSVPLTLDMTVTTLNLQGNAIGAEGLRYLAPCIQDSCSITHLNLNDNDLGSEGAAIMEKILMVNISLEAVSLAGNNFRDSDAVHFSQVALSPEKKPLKELDLSRNRLEDGAAGQFGEVLALNELLEVLDLSWNQIRPKGGVALINGLKDNPRLKRLAVSRNGVGDEGCEAAATALVTNRSLLELDLSGNRVTNKGMLALAKTIKNNDTLTVLKLGDNLATGLGAQAVGEAILRSEECAVTVLDLTNINVFDILIKEVREHAQSRPLTLKHGTISRFVLPMDELEKKFAEDFRTAHPELDTQANKDNEEDGDEKETKKSSKKNGSKKSAPKKTKRK